MILIIERVRLVRAKDPSRTCPTLMPYRHALVEAHHPPSKEDIHHVGVPRLDHLADLPKPIDKCGCSNVGEGEETFDTTKLLPHTTHKPLHVEGAGAISLIRRLQAVAPVVIDGPPLLCRHEVSDPKELDPKESDHLAEGDGCSRSVPPRFLNGHARLCNKDGGKPCHRNEVAKEVKIRLALGDPIVWE